MRVHSECLVGTTATRFFSYRHKLDVVSSKYWLIPRNFVVTAKVIWLILLSFIEIKKLLMKQSICFDRQKFS